MAASRGTSWTRPKTMEMTVPSIPVITIRRFPSVLAVFHAAAEEYPYPTMAPKEVRSTNQPRVFRPGKERRIEMTMMNRIL